jgi:hypothetical protein
MKIFGHVQDEKRDALILENPKSNNKYPHITLSVAEGVSPVYSNELIANAFSKELVEYFDEPIEIDVTEGYSDGANDITEPH